MDDEADHEKSTKNKMPKVAKVKNKMPAPVQITAEQLLREAKERELELVQPPPKQKISDEAELKDYRMRKRKAFEDGIRKNRAVISNWLKYAAWEESQQELQRARSVYERTLDVDHRNITVWLKYAEMEMKHRQVNHARNVWDRAVTILPRANQLWYKYTYMEEMLGNVAGCRQVFERWMDWEPEEQSWHSYINFELRHKELDRARVIYERFVIVHSTVKNWLKYAKFEEKNQYISSARRIYERAVEYFGDENLDESLMVSFAKFEESQREHERARVIYKYALDHLSKEKCLEIYRQYTIHEKKFGDRTAIEDVIVSKRKFKYEEDVKQNPYNYDSWFDYLRLMESDNKMDQVREVYERAIANVPPSLEKRHWRRYVYLWINYALYEELEAKDIERTRQVYQACLAMMPHKKFTFAKIWLMFAHFEVRQKNLAQARKILGTAIGKCPKDKLFRGYIELELQLREFDRCRTLYEKFLEFSPENCTTWIKFSEMETILGDVERARAIYELAINQPKLDMPEVLWKAYIDFELEQEEYAKTRNLYQRLLQRTKHVKVWLSFAQFELSINDSDSVEKCRGVYRQANVAMKTADEKEERLMLLEAWKDFEHEHGDEQTSAAVAKLLPNKVKRRRKIQTESGADAGWEEYYDYIFPDDETAQPNIKLLAMAKMWKKQQESSGADATETSENLVNGRNLSVLSAELNSDTNEQDEDRDDERTATEVDNNIDKDDSISGTSSEDEKNDDDDDDDDNPGASEIAIKQGIAMQEQEVESRLNPAQSQQSSSSDSSDSDSGDSLPKNNLNNEKQSISSNLKHSHPSTSGTGEHTLRRRRSSSRSSSGSSLRKQASDSAKKRPDALPDVKSDIRQLERRERAPLRNVKSEAQRGRKGSSSSSGSSSSRSPQRKRRTSSSPDAKPNVELLQQHLKKPNEKPPQTREPAKRRRSSSSNSSSSESRSPPRVHKSGDSRVKRRSPPEMSSRRHGENQRWNSSAGRDPRSHVDRERRRSRSPVRKHREKNSSSSRHRSRSAERFSHRDSRSARHSRSPASLHSNRVKKTKVNSSRRRSSSSRGSD